jgi:ubiquinone/menaquinone biosynthesis C-methylase UbiE
VKRWWLDELAHAGAEHLDEAYVAGYDRKAGFDPAPDVALLQAHGLGPGSTLLDVGAGTGTFAFAVAPHCGAVTAADVSPAMVAHLRRRAGEHGLANVTAVHGGFLSYEHQGSPFDFIYSRHALHQLPDFWKVVALERIARLLKPGGIALIRDLIFDFEPHELDRQIEAWMAGAVEDPRKGWTADELAEHLRSEFSTYRWLFEPMLAHAGLEVLESEYYRSAYGRYLCRKKG